MMSEPSTGEPASGDLEALIRSPSSRKALLAPSWLDKVSKKQAEEYLIDRILDNLSQVIPDNVVQLTIENHLTVEKISQRPEYREAIENQKRVFSFEIQKSNLPSFRPWVEFRARFCGIVVARLRFEYVAQPEISAKNVTITLLNNHLSEASIGCLEASIEMSMLVNAIPVKLGKIDRKLNHKIYHRFDEMLGLPESTHAPRSIHSSVAEEAETKFCIECGAKIPASWKFCRYCGANQDLMIIHA